MSGFPEAEYRGNPALYVLIEGFAYEGIQSLIAVYADKDMAIAAAKAHRADQNETHTWYDVIRVADQTQPFNRPT